MFCPESKLLCLSSGLTEAEVYLIDPFSALGDFEINTPLWWDLKTDASDKNVALTVPDQNTSVYRGKST